MKKLLSLVFGLALLVAFSTPATAAIKFSGDAQVRPRVEMTKSGESGEWKEELYWLYRLRLRLAADLGSGYFAKALLASESAGWFATISDGRGTVDLNGKTYNLFPDNLSDHFGVNQVYFGRMMQDSHYILGIMPVNSFNNPVFDLAVYPTSAVGIPYLLINNDRIFGLNYGRKVGPGELSATLCVLGDAQWDSTDDSFLRDEYAVHLMYKTNIGDVIIDPQLLAAVTRTQNVDIGAPEEYGHAPFTFGTNVIIPAGDTKFTLSGFYTNDGIGLVDDENGVDYSAYIVRAKAEHGPVRAWVSYNAADVKSPMSDDYENFYVWAQYTLKVYESSMGKFTLTPTVRYRDRDMNGSDKDTRWRTEVWANISF
ncbi:MAG: hypothetical protein C1941_03430 [Prosthecochloris sp.]|nr:hypothetical protein [Prosthecochloris sp.]